jgi:hypothetical protein
MFSRACVNEKGVDRLARVGEGFLDKPLVTTNAAAGNQTISVAQILGGVARFTGAAGAVTYTTPTAAALAAAMPDMDIGDTYMFKIVNTAAQTATIAGGTDVTAVAGLLTLNADSGDFLLEKTGAAAFNLYRI